MVNGTSYHSPYYKNGYLQHPWEGEMIYFFSTNQKTYAMFKGSGLYIPVKHKCKKIALQANPSGWGPLVFQIIYNFPK